MPWSIRGGSWRGSWIDAGALPGPTGSLNPASLRAEIRPASAVCAGLASKRTTGQRPPCPEPLDRAPHPSEACRSRKTLRRAVLPWGTGRGGWPAPGKGRYAMNPASDESEIRQTCRACGVPSPAGKKFCGDCGASLTLDDDRIRSLIDARISARFEDQKLVEVETAQAVVERISTWAKIFGTFVAVPLVLFAAFFARSLRSLLGLRPALRIGPIRWTLHGSRSPSPRSGRQTHAEGECRSVGWYPGTWLERPKRRADEPIREKDRPPPRDPPSLEPIAGRRRVRHHLRHDRAHPSRTLVMPACRPTRVAWA